ncbi:phosphodiester glycosidase family protein [Petrotoga sp. 9PWA.NaAc.5.4]|uniref:phosphodiester glycosidase family protein n=1 Tax=Petrotoga sp. 9PWA.NaAc.5.4 TaxID=1434328 RepID=UPI000CB0C07F|nr:phosphodiester glycosidase family protein [Petrotoga sp. 9PWA.NaAc.5.4]PNR96854.1 hypothetical protein X924_02510 [Petrotoga sp. 9PWA.NaAc.5.4]
MKKTFLVSVLFLLLTSILSADAIFLFQNKLPVHVETIKNQGSFYINVEELTKYDSMIINKTSRVIYIIYKKDVLEISLNDFYSKINFINKYDNSVILINNKTYIREDVLSYFLNLDYFKSLEDIFFYSDLPKIVDLKVSTNEISAVFDTYLDHSSITFTQISNTNEYLLTMKPMSQLLIAPSNVNYSYSNNTVYLKFKSDFLYDVNIQGKNLKVTVKNEPISRSDGLFANISQKKDFQYSEKVEEINGEKIKIYQLVVDPKKYDIKVDLNNLGVSYDVNKFLKEKNPLFSINASFFDTQTLQPIGNIMSDGELLHLSSYSRPALIITEDNRIDIDYVKLEFLISIEDLLFWVKSINSNWKGDVKLYTHHYKGNILETEKDYLFFLFNSDNELIAKRKAYPAENEKLLLIDKKYEKYVTNISLGSKMELTLNKSENLIENPILLLEGGPILINDEYSQEFLDAEKRSYSNGIIYSKSPRTVVAIDDKNMLVLMVIEGYDNPEIGLTYDETKNLLLKLGNYKKAMLLDGGSSSIVYYNGEIQNYKNGKTRTNIPVLLSVYEK